MIPQISEAEAARELHQALLFDLRDNPHTKEILDNLVASKGVKGAVEFNDMIMEDVKREFNKEPGPVVFPWTRAAVRTLAGGLVTYERFMGQFGAAITSILSTVAQVGGTVYAAKVNADAAKSVAKIKVEADNRQAAAAQAQAEAAKAQALAAMQAQMAPMGMTAEQFQSSGGGAIPSGEGIAAPSPIPGLSIGTMMLIGGGALALIFIVPKLLKK